MTGRKSCTIDQDEGGGKAKDLLRTAPGSPQEPGIWTPKLHEDNPRMIRPGPGISSPSEWPSVDVWRRLPVSDGVMLTYPARMITKY